MGTRLEGKTAVELCIQHVSATPVPPSQVAANGASCVSGELDAGRGQAAPSASR